MDVTGYALLAGALLSLLFAYVPGVKGWYEKIPPDYKQLVMLGSIFIVVAGRFGLSCLGKDTQFACSYDGGYEALKAFVLAIAANAGVYKATSYIGR